MLRNQLSDLILNESLTTTEARAKVLKSKAERFISRAKKLDLASRRRVLTFLTKKEAAEKLFARIIPQFFARVGGYVRVVKLPYRRGDNAPMARVEFVEKIAEPAEKEKREKTQKKSEKKQTKGEVAKSPKKVAKRGEKS